MDLERRRSLLMSDIVAALGFSVREVNMRSSLAKFFEDMDNLFHRYCIHKDKRNVILTGSRSEGMTGGNFYSGEKSDVDLMILFRFVKVVDKNEDSIGKDDKRPDGISPVTVQEINDKDYPGYVKLIVVTAHSTFHDLVSCKDGQYFLSSALLTKLDVQNPFDELFDLKEPVIHGPALNRKVITKIPTQFPIDVVDCTLSTDNVHCLMSSRSRYWYQKFMTRSRPRLWPKKETVDYIVHNAPVYLVPVGHKSSPDVDLQWRVSFNVAENLLVKDFNETQIKCYALLKICLKDNLNHVSPDILSSYCMKTSMFWLSEREGSDNMVPEKLLHYFVTCLKMIQTWLKSHKMPHYFTEKRNLFRSNLDELEVGKLLQAIDKAISEPFSEILDCKSFDKISNIRKENKLSFSIINELSYMISWMFHRYSIPMSIYDDVERMRLLMIPYMTKDILKCTERFKQMVEDTKTISYGQCLLKVLKSCLGFLCFSYHCDSLGNMKDKICGKEIETLLLEGKDGDLAFCPLKLATFYLKLNNISKVLKITKSVLKNRQQIQMRHDSLDLNPDVFLSHLNLFLQNQEVIKQLKNIAIIKVCTKSNDEMVCYREGRPEVQLFLYYINKLEKELTFDVTFMLHESFALPREVQRELAFTEPITIEERYCIGVTISPLVYTLYLRFLAFKAKSDLGSCLVTLFDFQDLLPQETLLDQSKGYNLLASCYGMMGSSREAAESLCCSLRLNPTRNNVAFGYLAFMYRLLFR